VKSWALCSPAWPARRRQLLGAALAVEPVEAVGSSAVKVEPVVAELGLDVVALAGDVRGLAVLAGLDAFLRQLASAEAVALPGRLPRRALPRCGGRL
jgi:hypothetical protein